MSGASAMRGVGWVLSLVPPIFSFWLLGAHFLRWGQRGAALACLLLPLVLAGRSAWIRRAVQVLLLGGAGFWVTQAIQIGRSRAAAGESWGRMALILGAVAALTAGSALVLQGGGARRRFSEDSQSGALSLGAWALTAALLATVQLQGGRPLLLLERFLPGGGWIEVALLPLYAAWLSGRLWDTRTLPIWRRRLWTLFSLAIFGQLLLGLGGFERFLMTGELHPPVPALIVGTPLFRGGGFFMPILFASTLLVVGPAWCSYLCYIGAWDLNAAWARKRPLPLPRWARWGRPATLVLVVAAAFGLRLAGVAGPRAAALAVAFGLLGVAIMVLLSRRAGAMVHCVAYCPIGLLATTLGKASPFRLRILHGCTDCGACTTACRYDALNAGHIARRRPGANCTLCGDCLHRCHDRQIQYRFLALGGKAARGLFLALAVALHALFLGVAML